MRRTMTAGQWSAYARNTDTLGRRVMPQIDKVDPRPKPQPTVTRDRVNVAATTRNETGRVWSF